VDLKLTVTCEVDGRERTYDLEFMKDLVTLGRHSKNDVRIPDMAVGPDHARIEARGGGWILTDLGTGPATVVDGKPAEPGVPVALREGSEIRVSSFRVTIRKPTLLLDESTSEKTSMVAMNMVREVLGSISRSESPPRFDVLNDNEAGAKLELPEDREYRVGRDSDCDLILKHWSISRKHALIRRALDQVTVADLGSKNGVSVNDVKISESRILRNGDVVSVGHTELRFWSPLHSLLDSLDGIEPPSRRPKAEADAVAADSDSTRTLGPPATAKTPDGDRTPTTGGGETTKKSSTPLVLAVVIAAAVLGALFLFVL
jgi:pSer/pThr/pTyr-binding forkhead associated (FHA) protein